MVHPIIDKYYERDPHHVRSSAFVQAKGLTSNEKNRSDAASPAGQDRQQQELDGYRKMMTGTLSLGQSRSLSPDVCRQTRKLAPGLVPVHVPVPEPIPVPQPAQVTPPAEQSNKPTPAQGNIKVKRRSVQLLDINQGSNDLDQISDTDEPARADVRNPKKLSQYFPELTLASHAG
jgi:glutamine amidotransferase